MGANALDSLGFDNEFHRIPAGEHEFYKMNFYEKNKSKKMHASHIRFWFELLVKAK
jgi:hypothetical protein